MDDTAPLPAPPTPPMPDSGGVSFDIESLERLLALGGPVVVLLALLSIAALGIAIYKLLQFRRAKIWRTTDVASAVAVYRGGDPDAAETRLAATDSALGRTVGAAIAADRTRRPEVAREVAEIAAASEIESLRGGLRPLEFIAGVSPLLGLFGTVLGMIAAFQALEAAGDKVDPAILAGGIWEALFTTAAGLAVAIPALALSNWFERALDALAHKMEHYAGLALTRPEAEAEASHPSLVAAE